MKDWTGLGLRGLPPMSARSKPAAFPPFLQPVLDAAAASTAEPLVGITTDGRARGGPFPLHATGVSTAPIVEAAQDFLAKLDARQRVKVLFDLDADERRLWFNIHPNVFRHGLILEDLAPAQRKAALRLMETTLSARGFAQARDIMRINALLIEVTGKAGDYGEWPYFVTLFGSPSADAPWGWQIDGHHLNLNFFVLGDQLVFTPSFMRSEPCRVASGPLAGTEVFAPDALSDAQRRLLLALLGTYVGWARDGHAAVKLTEVAAHLDETHFAWMGATGDEGPFYYRVHSPVVLVELDHHPGIVFDNLAPSRHHVHTIIRTPNGGDYGADLLRQHHERFDHSSGRHAPRR